jgi:hypothetical protein
LEILAEELRFARETLAHLKRPLPADDIALDAMPRKEYAGTKLPLILLEAVVQIVISAYAYSALRVQTTCQECKRITLSIQPR